MGVAKEVHAWLVAFRREGLQALDHLAGKGGVSSDPKLALKGMMKLGKDKVGQRVFAGFG